MSRTGLVAAFVLLATPAAEAYWEVQPLLQTGITYEDNPRYISNKSAAEAINPGITDDLLGTYVDARVTGLFETPNNKFSVTPEIRKSDYLKSDELNTDDWNVAMSADHTGNRGAVGLDGSYRENSLRNSQFESAIPDNPDSPPPIDGGSGRFSTDTQQVWELRPSLTYVLSPRNSVRLDSSLAASKYDQQLVAPGGRYFDYHYSSTDLSVQQTLDSKNRLILTLNGGRFTTEQPESVLQNSTDSFGIKGGYDHTFSKTLAGTASVGVSRSSTTVSGIPLDPPTGLPCSPASTCTSKNEGRNFVGDISLKKRSELTNFNLSLERSIAPTSNGREVVQDQLRLYMDHRFTGKLSGSLGGLLTRESSLFSARTALGSEIQERVKRTYFTIGATASWRLTETLSASGSYNYISEDNGSTGNSRVANNQLSVGVVYQPVGFRP